MCFGYYFYHCSCSGNKNRLRTNSNPTTIPMAQMFAFTDFNTFLISFIIPICSITTLLAIIA